MRRSKGCLDIAVTGAQHERLRGDAGCETAGSRTGVQYRGQLMGLDRDKLGAVFGQIGMGREHSRYRLADITQPLAREKRLAIGTQRLGGRIAKIDGRQVVDVRRSPHRDDFRHGQCSGHVDGPQLGIRISRAHDAHMQLMREPDIADEGPLPGQQRRILQPNHRLAEDAVR